MLPASPPCSAHGIIVSGGRRARSDALAMIADTGLAAQIHCTDEGDNLRLAPTPAAIREWAPEHDTLGLAGRLELNPLADDDLQRETLLAMLASPTPYHFACADGLASAIRVRCGIVAAARKTALSFDTEAAERPAGDWSYAEDTGFTLRPGRPLIGALEKATQPDRSGKRYAFSCYRATEYVILLAIARELAHHHPALLEALQARWERRAIMSREFHDTFLHEHGSMQAPLPPRFYVPGDRVWFRNPDEASSDVAGYEGSWVFYLGGGLFSNFWHPEHPYTLTDKCLEIHHWRHGLQHERDGTPYMDETVVETRVAQTRQDPAATAAIIERMMRFRDPGGVYADGGCIDSTREHPRCLCQAAPELRLAAA